MGILKKKLPQKMLFNKIHLFVEKCKGLRPHIKIRKNKFKKLLPTYGAP
jgi:hypothetical protein